MAGAYRDKRRQRGYGGGTRYRTRRQKGYGLRTQKGSGPKWDAFKARAKKIWGYSKPVRDLITPRAKKAIWNALPKIENKLLQKKGDWKTIGREGLRDFVGGRRRCRRIRRRTRRR